MQSPCAMLSSVSYPALQYFLLYSIKGKTLYMLLNMTLTLWFSLQIWFEKFLILRRIQGETSTNLQRLISKLPVTLSDYPEPLLFWQTFKKYWNNKLHQNPSISSRKVPRRQMGRHTGTTNFIVTLRNSVKAPKNYSSIWGLDPPACLRRLI